MSCVCCNGGLLQMSAWLYASPVGGLGYEIWEYEIRGYVDWEWNLKVQSIKNGSMTIRSMKY